MYSAVGHSLNRHLKLFNNPKLFNNSNLYATTMGKTLQQFEFCLKSNEIKCQQRQNHSTIGKTLKTMKEIYF